MAEEVLDANAAQRRYWNTVAGPRWVAAPGFRERRNHESTALLLARLGITGGENVLEIGCGTGALTVPLAAVVGDHGRLVAVDISEPMLGVARQRVEERGLHNVKLLPGDAQVFEFELAAFDLVTSRMGVMFFANPTAAFRNIGGALKPGGRLIFACWGPLEENRHWLISYDIANSPILPLIGGGTTKFQPVFIDDMTAGLLELLNYSETAGKTYEFGGPQVYSFKTLLELLMTAINRRRILIPIPFALAEMQAGLLELFPTRR